MHDRILRLDLKSGVWENLLQPQQLGECLQKACQMLQIYAPVADQTCTSSKIQTLKNDARPLVKKSRVTHRIDFNRLAPNPSLEYYR